MTDNTVNQPKKSRRWRRWLLLLGAIAALVIIQHLLRSTRLHPVTRRLLPAGCQVSFSLEGYGYPAMQTNQHPHPNDIEATSGLLLDDRCMPIPRSEVAFWRTQISPTRRYATWARYRWTARGKALERRAFALDGTTARACQPYSGLTQPAQLTDAGLLYPAPLPKSAPRQGDMAQWVTLPPAKPWYAWSVAPCAGTGYLVLMSYPRGGMVIKGRAVYKNVPPDDHIYIYDPAARRMLTSASWKFTVPPGYGSVCFVGWGQPSMVFHHAHRFLLIPPQGPVLVLEPGKPSHTVGAVGTIWRYGEDGTVWTISGKTVRVLHWQQGTPRLVTSPQPVRPDAHVGDGLHAGGGDIMFLLRSAAAALPGAGGVAEWGEGEYAARTETVPLMPDVIHRLVERGRKLLGRTSPFPREGRRLTLYRRGKRLGTFTVRLKPIAAIPKPYPPGGPIPSISLAPTRTWYPYQEHLAFTADGHYLSWVIDAGYGLQVYVFQVQ